MSPLEPGLHWDVWLERGMAALALAAGGFGGRLVATMRRRDKTAQALAKLSADASQGFASLGATVDGIYRRMGRTEAGLKRVEEHLNLTPSPLGEEPPTSPGSKNGGW